VSETFAELGLRPELLRAAEKAGLERPTDIQAGAIPVLRRGANAVLHASTGSGVTAACALALLDRLAEAAAQEGRVPASGGDGPAALVVVATAERAAEVATTFARLGAGTGLRSRALGPGWNRAAPAHVLVASAAAALRALERSQLKLHGLVAFLLEGASAVLSLTGRDALETLLSTVPREAQRVLVSGVLTEEVERFAEAHVKKAMHVPHRPADPRDLPAPHARGAVAYVAVPEDAKEEALARLLGNRLSERPVVLARSAARATALAERMALRGFAADAVDVRVTGAGPGEEEGRPLLAHDVPADEAPLAAVAASGGVVFATPAELTHLRRIATAAGLTLEAVETPPSARDDLAAFRDAVRRALADADLEAHLLLLEPLFREASAPEVAAALAALLRARPASAAEAAPARRGGQAADTRKRAPSAPTPPGPEPFVRLFLSAGAKDGLRPADLVGAIAGETSLSGDRVGRIDIRDTFSVVEVPGSAADEVIRALNGRSLRGRAVRVDYDRKGGAPRAGGATGRPPRGSAGGSGGASRGPSRGPARGPARER
jgi:ATP-dependent RNA helicase DeaD